jgi:hypothetical protein
MTRRISMSRPNLIRFMRIHTAYGIVIGCMFLLVLMHFDLAGLGSLLAKDRSGLATAVRFFQTASIFGAVPMGIAVMNFEED